MSFRHSRDNKSKKPFQQYCTNFSYSDSSQIKKDISNGQINGSNKPIIITPTLKKKKLSQIINSEKDLCDELMSAYNRRSFDSYENHLHSLRNCSCVDFPDLYLNDNNKSIYPKEKFYGNAKILGDLVDQKNNQIRNNIRNSDNKFDNIRNKQCNFMQNKKQNTKNCDPELYLNSDLMQRLSLFNTEYLAPYAYDKILKRQNETICDKLNNKSKSLPSLFGSA